MATGSYQRMGDDSAVADEAVAEILAASRNIRRLSVRARLWMMAWASALVICTAIVGMRFSWSGFDARELTPEQARAVLLEEVGDPTKRVAAAFRLRNTAYLAVEALRATSRSSDPEVAKKARIWLEQLREQAKRE